MFQPDMRCVEFVEAVTEWLEGALDGDERLVLEEHLAICPHCLDYLGELRLAIELLRRTDVTPAPPLPSRDPDASGRSSTGDVTATPEEGARRHTAAAPPPAMRAALLAAFRERRPGSGS